MNSTPPFPMALDEPTEKQSFVAGHAVVRGWALCPEGLSSVSAKVGDSDWVDLALNKSRFDVARAFPDRLDAEHSGFGARLDVSRLAAGEYELLVRMTSKTGRTVEVKREIKVESAEAGAREISARFDDDQLHLKLEEPAPNTFIHRGSVLRVIGWALARTEIEKVEVWLDGRGPHLATYGIMREDLSLVYDDFPGSTHARFLWTAHTGALEPGLHGIRVLATARSGRSSEITDVFEIDARSEYAIWAGLRKPGLDQLLAMHESCARLQYAPKMSIVTPVYRTPEAMLRRCVDSVKHQVYPNWELVLVDDGSGDRRLAEWLAEFQREDRRIQVHTLKANSGIAVATNTGLEHCSGEFVGFLDHDDELSPDALFRVVEMLGADRSLDMVYSDEDKIDEQGNHSLAFFKPRWSPDLLRSMNYVCHFLVCRRTLIESAGRVRTGFDGSQDYDLVLRLIEKTNRIDRVPHVLYHWRMHRQSTAGGVDQKPAASENGRRALQEHLDRTGVKAQAIEIGPGRYRIKHEIAGEPEVAIIIPTGGSPTLEAALTSILEKSTYRNYKILVVDNSRGEAVRNRVKAFGKRAKEVQLLDCRDIPFNFSLLCNRGAKAVHSPILLFLNDDTTVISPDWIESMLEHAQRKEIGAVGAKLYFPNNTIQHAGVIMGLFGLAGHAFRGLPEEASYFELARVICNYAAVTGACLMTRRDAFESVGGFDEPNLPTCFQDVDLCLRMLEHGFLNLYTPFAQLYHYESFSKKSVAGLPECHYMEERWGAEIADDPFYNPNLTRHSDDFAVSYDALFSPLDKLEKRDKVDKRDRPDKLDQKSQEPAESKPATTARSATPAAGQSAAEIVRRLGAPDIQFEASPNPAVPAARGLGQTTLSWKAPRAKRVQVRVGSPLGPLFAEGGPSGKAATGPWIQSGTVFYLQDASQGDPTSAEQVLATVRVVVRTLSKATSA